MYYSELVRKACWIMYDAHREDVDKGGYPYAFHPFYLAVQMDDEESACAALLQHPVTVEYFCLQRQAVVVASMQAPAQTAQFLSRCLAGGQRWVQAKNITLEEL